MAKKKADVPDAPVTFDGEVPRWIYHATEPTKRVETVADCQAALDAGWVLDPNEVGA